MSETDITNVSSTAEAESPVKAKTMEIPVDELLEEMKEVEAYESNEDNFLSLAELGAKLFDQKGNSRLTLKEKRKLFSEKGLKNPNDEDVTINDRDDDYEAYLELEASFQSGHKNSPPLFLRATVDSVMYTKNYDNILLICYMGAFEVRIPVSEFMWLDGLQNRKNTNISMETLFDYCEMRIGSECSFKVEAIDTEHKVAYASRIKAIGIEGFANWVRKRENEQPRYVVGQKVLAKVVCVQNSFLICEAFGAEFTIRDEELMWGGLDDVHKYFHIGDTFYVKVLDVGFEIVDMPSGAKYKKVNVVASKRLLDPNPFIKYASRYREGLVTTAIVTRVSDAGLRLTLGTKERPTITSAVAQFPLFLPSDERPRVGDTVRVMITKLDMVKNVVYCKFEKVLSRED